MVKEMHKHQVLVVGGGMAGLRAALESYDQGADTAVISQVHPIRSHSGAAQGGINGSLANVPEGKDDNWERHAFDTVKGSDFLADQDAVETMTKEAAIRIIELEHMGTPFSRTEEGKIAQRPFGGAGYPRTCFASDKTGHVIMQALYEQLVKRQVKVYAEYFVVTLAVQGDVCRGLVALNILTGDLESFEADAVIMATGGAGRIYARSSNAIINTGSGMAVAYQAGAPLKDMEFIQFHPTTLLGSNILMTEAARGEGGYLVNNQGERFMQRYTPKVMELAPRDIVSRSIQTEIDQGRGFPGGCVHLDLRHLGREKILERLPGIRDIAMNFAGVDPILQPIPIQPSQHYTMGGIDCSVDGETVLKGLLTAGECACVSVHGANRLGGNSLLDTVVFGHRSGKKAAQYAQDKHTRSPAEKALNEALAKAEKKINALAEGQTSEPTFQLRSELGETMTNKVGIFRDKGPMTEAVQKIKDLKRRYKGCRVTYKGKKFNLDLLRTLELEGCLQVAEVIAQGALARQESRGSHTRLDFKDRDDVNWLKHTLAYYTADGPQMKYKPVIITRWQPEARKY